MSAHAVLAPSILSTESLGQIESAVAASSHVSLILRIESIRSSSAGELDRKAADLALRDHLKVLADREDVSVSVLGKQDLKSMHEWIDLENLIYIAHDGLEIEAAGRRLRNPDAEAARRELRCLCLQLKLALADLGNVVVEERELGLTVRYNEAEADMGDLIAQRSEDVIRSRNFFTPTRTNDAVEARLKTRGYAGWAACCLSRSVLPPNTLGLYLGDHLTVQNIRDATVDGITIEVGNTLSSAAQYALPDTAAVGRFLSWLEHAKPHASISNPLPAGERPALV